MVINGKQLAQKILDDVQKRVQDLQTKHIQPKLAIVTIGEEASWKTYVRQKIRTAEKLDITTELITLSNPKEEELFYVLSDLDEEPTVHGIIVQRPIPNTIDSQRVTNAISLSKDIDGFRNDSPYEVPTWQATRRILEYIYSNSGTKYDFQSWLISKLIAIIGKGETAGEPIIQGFKNKNVNPIVIDSRSNKAILKQADIVVSAVGKRVVEPKFLKAGVVLIGVGIHREEDGKLHGDYSEKEIENIASFYTPTPGGVGPINLAYLFKNLIGAAESSS